MLEIYMVQRKFTRYLRVFFSRWLILMMSLTQWKQTSLCGSTKGKRQAPSQKGILQTSVRKEMPARKDPQVDLERLVVQRTVGHST